MLDLSTVIRTRVATQLEVTGKYTSGLQTALQRAVWIYDEYGIHMRTQSSTRNPIKRLLRGSALKIPIGKANRLLDHRTVAELFQYHRLPPQDLDLVEIVRAAGKIEKYDLAQQLDIQLKQLTYRLRKERKAWNVLQKGDDIWFSDHYIEYHDLPSSSPQELLISILGRYPYLTADQLSYLTGIPIQNLAQPIHQLVRSHKLKRGITRMETPDEIFTLADHEPLGVDEAINSFVLEKRDALVELITLERYFEHGESDYWFFADGIPQAEFDLQGVSRRKFKLEGFQRFSTSTYSIQDILDQLGQWGEKHKIHIDIHDLKDPMAKFGYNLVDFLIKRGYRLEDRHLVLNLQQNKPSAVELTSDTGLNWSTLGLWTLQQQGFRYTGSPADLVRRLGQVDDIRGLAYRLHTKPSSIDFSGVVFTSGINYRLGFVHEDDIQDIVLGWPKMSKYNTIDRKILKNLDDFPTTHDLENLGKSATIRQRLRYLEKVRRIRRMVRFPLHFDECHWMTFRTDLDEPITGTTTSNRDLASVGKFLVRLLNNNPPLTLDQISRYLGITKRELHPLISQYLNTGEVSSGYFFDNISDEQYTTSAVLDAELDENPVLSSNRVDILPISDAFAMLHLPLLVMSDSSIQPAQRPAPGAEEWMITWDGAPVGYFIKTPTTLGEIDYELEIRITKGLVTTPIITGTIEQVVSIMRGWYNEEGKLVAINDDKPSSRKWEHIQFLIESIGIDIV